MVEEPDFPSVSPGGVVCGRFSSSSVSEPFYHARQIM